MDNKEKYTDIYEAAFNLLNESNHGLWKLTLPQGTFTIFGEALIKRVFGMKKPALSLRWQEFLDSYCHPDDKVRIMFELESVVTEETPFNMQLRVLRAGVEVMLNITSSLKKQGEELHFSGTIQSFETDSQIMSNYIDLQEATHRSKVMLDTTPLCCNFWNENYENIDCNQEAANLFKLTSKQEYLDRFFELSPEFQPDGERSDIKAQRMVKKAFNEGRAKFEWMHQMLDETPVPAEITLVRIPWGEGYIVAGYTLDLRERMAMQASEREADERTKVMLDAMPLCCNFWNSDHENIDCNQEAANLFDLSSKQEYLDRFFELSPEFQPDGESSQVKANRMIQTAFDEGRIQFEWMHQKLDGTPVPSEITLVRVLFKGDYIVLGYTRDLRTFKEMLAEIRKTEEELRVARDAAEASAKAKSEFLANMSHEIRTPMNAILGMLHLALQGDVTEKQRFYLEKSEQSAKSLLRIINDILDFSKIEAGRLEMERLEFTLDSVISGVFTIIEDRVGKKPIRLSQYIAPDVPNNLIGDALRLTQVLLNLVNNAVKFTDEGSLTLTVSLSDKEANLVELEFCVADTGIGMTQRQVESLFSPFMQADTSTTRKYGGTGLGLAISKSLVTLMGGRIWCSSAPGKGSKFSFTARFRIAEQSSRKLDPERDNIRQNESSLEGVRILLAEDNETNQILATELLLMEGCSVDLANNGKEAIALLNANEYDLVLMDIQMPEMDGITASREIRKDKRFRDIPILAMTAHAMTGDRELSLKAGMNDHVTKPIEPELFYAALRRWIKR